MRVKVKFLANIGIFMDMREITLDLGDSKKYTIRDVIEEITKTTGKDLKKKVMGETDESTGQVRIIINGKNIDSLSKLDTEVSDNDEISIFPALGAG